MSLCKRGGVWWIDIRAPNGERIRRTTETASKALAQFHDRTKSELAHLQTFGQAAVPVERCRSPVAEEQSHKATSEEDVTVALAACTWVTSLSRSSTAH